MARRLFSYPVGLAVVVAALIATTGGFIAWWNYRTGVDNVRQLAGRPHGRVAVTTSEDRKSTRLNSSHIQKSRMPSSA